MNLPRVGPDETYLREREQRFREPLPPLLLRIEGNAVQLPTEAALATFVYGANPIADVATAPDIILSEDDLDDELHGMLQAAA